jgi:aspartyl-tRNA(Asn)/glutamyl-tRNA(Gln) amidotransferase subunit A
MYLSDLYTMFVNLARIPSISVPAGYTKPASDSAPSLPAGIQFAGAMFSEPFILSVSEAWEKDHPGCGVPSVPPMSTAEKAASGKGGAR